MNQSDWRSDPIKVICMVEVVYFYIIKMITIWILSKLGFHGTEIVYGSLAWRYQKWRGYISQGSLFSLFQSVAATGFAWNICILLQLGIAYYIQYPFQNVNDGLLCFILLGGCYFILDYIKEVRNPGQSTFYRP